MLLLLSADFSKLTISKNSLRNTIRESSNGLAPDIWVQNVCKGYQQMTKVVTSKERVKDTLD